MWPQAATKYPRATAGRAHFLSVSPLAGPGGTPDVWGTVWVVAVVLGEGRSWLCNTRMKPKPQTTPTSHETMMTFVILHIVSSDPRLREHPCFVSGTSSAHVPPSLFRWFGLSTTAPCALSQWEQKPNRGQDLLCSEPNLGFGIGIMDGPKKLTL